MTDPAVPGRSRGPASDAGSPEVASVLIVGAGLLGASIGLGLRNLGVETWLRDASPTAEAVGEDIGAGLSERAWGARMAEPQLVVVASPPDVTVELVAAALTEFPHTVVTDVASVKGSILRGLEEAGADLSRYVGSHPMAGREKSGPVAARGELFTSMPWVLCSSEHTAPSTRRLVKGLAIELGATVTEMPAEEHDDTVALISHLPQVMSSLLASRLQDTPLHRLSLAGQGLRDTTRIAASDPGLWVQILTANAGAIVPALHGVREDLERLIETMEAPTAPGSRLDVAQLIAEGNAGQARIPGKHGGAPKAFAQLTVLVDDRPGTIAHLLTFIGEIGINLEDLRLDHSPGQPVGLAEVSVEPNRRDELVEALTTNGWKVVQ
ncbi:prephenate dehydrogenase [Kocuria coralli]|uniref:Prephenate dehydrogenase n=1 Tax=Kocuria coralli TaxID=1461025 RepID=A0A5J5KTI3_9MICC|nr:prephenate dehydrogenase [Kocuria coralli]KAA9393039.1 prephenate dehydrogenase [Kocuria coralli]